MARLNHAGQELVRAVKTQPGDNDTEWRKTFLTLYSTGWVLRKYQVRYKADPYRSAHNHDWGWKRYLRVKPNMLVADVVKVFFERGYNIEYESSSYEKVRVK